MLSQANSLTYRPYTLPLHQKPNKPGIIPYAEIKHTPPAPYVYKANIGFAKAKPPTYTIEEALSIAKTLKDEDAIDNQLRIKLNSEVIASLERLGKHNPLLEVAEAQKVKIDEQDNKYDYNPENNELTIIDREGKESKLTLKGHEKKIQEKALSIVKTQKSEEEIEYDPASIKLKSNSFKKLELLGEDNPIYKIAGIIDIKGNKYKYSPDTKELTIIGHSGQRSTISLTGKKVEIQKALALCETAERLAKGAKPQLKDDYYVGYYDPKSGTKSNSPVFQEWLDKMFKNTPEAQKPKTATPIIMRTSNYDEIHSILKEDLIPMFQFSGHAEVPTRKRVYPKFSDALAKAKEIGFKPELAKVPLESIDLKLLKKLGDDNPLKDDETELSLKGKEQEIKNAWALYKTAVVLYNERKTKDVEVRETMMFPFLSAIINGNKENISEQVKPVLGKLDKVDIYNIKVPGNPELSRHFQKQITPVREQMIGIEVAKMQYFERMDIKEVAGSLAAGAGIGVGGEFMVHTFLHGGGIAALVARMGVLAAVDFVDNLAGEMGAFRSDLDANGLKMTKKDIYGTDKWTGVLKNPLNPKGPGGIFAKRAATAAIKGAGTGMLTSSVTAGAVTNQDMNIIARSVGAGVGSWGTALSIPFNIRATLPQLQATTIYLMEKGLINVPDSVLPEELLKDKEKVKNLSPKEKIKLADKDKLKVATTLYSMQEMMARVGFSSSMRAFVRVPLVGALLLSQAFGVPPEAASMLFMGAAASSENLLRLIITDNMLRKQKPADVEKMRGLILRAHNGEISREEAIESINKLMAAKKDTKVGQLLTKGASKEIKIK